MAGQGGFPLAAVTQVRPCRQPQPGVPCALPLGPGGPVPEPLRAAAAADGFAGRAGQVAGLSGPGPAWLLGTGADPDWEAVGGAAEARRRGLGAAAPERMAIDARGLSPAAAAGLAAGVLLRGWTPPATRRPDPEAPCALAQLDLVVDDPPAALAAWERLEPGVRGALYARDLVAEPGNRLTPRRFAERLEALAAFGLEVEVFGRKRLEREGFGGLLAVGRGAAEPPRLVVLRWRGTQEEAPVVFVGKGVTFDTGGISIKPAQGMEAMRADMAGAAACAGAMLALALRGGTHPAAAVLAIAENATGAASYRPSDVLTMHGGRTVEVVDTDAEGRLVLADALDYAATALRPRALLDLATLTGSIVTALGHHRAGIFGNDEALMGAAIGAGEAVGEPLWPMPIGERHRADLDSAIADLRHCLPAGAGEGWGGRFLPDACHAAAFLRAFVGDTPWAHLDIAGVETWEEDSPLGPKGPSGFGARLLDRLMAMRFEERVRRRRG
ncbi:leucyl aminopeptidase family protein [Roseomonas sp. OT10]|uniref:leucyl aminopeptidase family protein n=1 Tax=Roseomonas cutis TaxID=2897332 RepID=UPI001E3BB7DD|nr:leucyl aminopeptidase family protein [Roseomonas sp. OT10]UFN50050.1 leucyl aminopeptidase family protein [Roseomonas sp. OT10]